MPKSFERIGQLYISEIQVFHFSEHFGSLNKGICHFQVLRIPQSSTSSIGEKAVFYYKTIVMPKRILAFEATIVGFNITTFFDCRLTGMNSYIVQLQIVSSKQRTFATKFFVFYQFHY